MTAALTMTLLCSGCVLPIPSRTTMREGLTGRVIDSRTEQPISGASVSATFVSQHSRAAGTQTAATDASGVFRVPPEQMGHWGFLLSPGLSYPLPYPDRTDRPHVAASVAISRAGYSPLRYTFPTLRQRTADPKLDYDTPQPEQNRTYRLSPVK
jgi:hypothetical protein